MEGTAMSRTDAAQEIASYLAGPVPEGAVEDLRDLGVIGFSNELPGVTPLTMQTLIAGAVQKGRSWQEIGRRLDMTADEAEQAYRELGEGRQQSTGWRHVIATALSGLAAGTDALSNALNRASYGLQRSHH
jgi:hypothetical protein